MTARLPEPGGDDNIWGQVLNDYLAVSHTADGSLKSAAIFAQGAAQDSAVVHTTGDESVGGTKTFTTSPKVPTPAALADVANKQYVDSVATSGAPDATTTATGLVQLAGDFAGTAQAPVLSRTSLKELPLNPLWPQYGAKGDSDGNPGVGTDDTAALNACFADAILQGREVVITAKHRVSGALQAIVTANHRWFGMRGLGDRVGFYFDTALNNDGFYVGGVASTGATLAQPSGYITGVTIQGPSTVKAPTSAGHYAGLKLSALRQFWVANVMVDYFEVGLDLINNCYGATFYNNRIGGFGRTYCCINLRTGADSGSDLVFINTWASGRKVAVSMSPGLEGVHFYGGQLSVSGATTDEDDAGVIIWGKDYTTGTVGGLGGAQFVGVDFEGFQRCWLLRGYGEIVRLAIRDSAILATVSANPAIGVLKTSSAEQSKITFEHNTLRGYFSSPQLLSVSTHYSTFELAESGWFQGTPTQIAGATVGAQNVKSIADQSGWRPGARWTARRGYRTIQAYENAQIRSAGSTGAGALEFSADNGTSWMPLVKLPPTDVPNLALHLAADRLVTVPDGTTLDTWRDISGNGFDALALSGSQPTFIKNGINGLPSVRFDGAASYMNIDPLGSMPNSTSIAAPFTVVAVIAKRDATSTGAIMSFGNASNNTPEILFEMTTSPAWRYIVRTNDTTMNNVVFSSYDTSPQVFCAVFDGSAMSVWSNNAVKLGATVVAGDAMTLDKLTLGALGRTTYSDFGAIDIAEFVLYNRALNDGERSLLCSTVGSKWRLSI